MIFTTNNRYYSLYTYENPYRNITKKRGAFTSGMLQFDKKGTAPAFSLPETEQLLFITG